MTVKENNVICNVKAEAALMAKEVVSNSSGSSERSGDENLERGNWTGKLDFMMSCVSYAVGLGNIWRFPYLCYRNGGAVFLIPYLTCLVLIGMPLFFMEIALGQFASLSPITIWQISPIFKGLGIGMVLISGICCIYYNIIITWTLYYLFQSFSRVLPWSTCDNSWNTPACTHGDHLLNVTSYNATPALGNVSRYGVVGNGSIIISGLGELKRTTPSEEYWERHVLQLSSGIEELGGVRWELLGFLALAWVMVFLCLIRGIKSSGKVVYFTATFPYLVLICLFVRGITLPGSMDGIRFYVIPQWHKLFQLKVWGEAAMQIFFSMGPAWGALITMSSYNKFNHDFYRDARILPILNCSTSIFAGCVIFSIIGFMAHETGRSVEDVVTQGPGLVFVVYPEAIARLPFSQIWAFMFFTMLFSLGIGSQMGMFQTMTSAFADEYAWVKDKKVLVTAALCFIEFVIGIPCITRGGIYVLQVMDWYSSTFSLMIIAFSECLIIGWLYGVEQFYKDITMMIGYRPCGWWRLLWCYITPGLILFVLTFSIVIHTPVTYGTYIYPGWAIGLGWLFALCSIVPLPTVAIYRVMHETGPIRQRISKLSKPAEQWGPALEQYRELYKASIKHSATTLAELDTTKRLNGGDTTGDASVV